MMEAPLPPSAKHLAAPHLVRRKSLRHELVLDDSIYGGRTTLSAPADALLLDLIQSPAVQRLKTVLQHGISPLLGLCGTPWVTRYEHSVGAMLMVRKAGATIEEQAAALLHDVSHTALSHVVDGVFGRVVHETDKMFYLNTTSIASIISSYGLDPSRVLDEELFPLVEQPSGELCADRGDYGLRDSVNFGTLTPAEATWIASHIVNHEHRLVFSALEPALKMCEAYLRCDQIAWAHPVHSVNYYYSAQAIKLAFDKEELKFMDLWSKGCEQFWDGLVNSEHDCVRAMASQVRGDLEMVPIPLSEVAAAEAEGRKVQRLKHKVRTLNPLVLVGDGKVKHVMDLDLEYAARVEAYKLSKKDELCYEVRIKGANPSS